MAQGRAEGRTEEAANALLMVLEARGVVVPDTERERILGEILQFQRVTWLRGKVAAGLAQNAVAEAAFRQVRSVFQEQGLAYDYALVSLDLPVAGADRGRSCRLQSPNAK